MKLRRVSGGCDSHPGGPVFAVAALVSVCGLGICQRAHLGLVNHMGSPSPERFSHG